MKRGREKNTTKITSVAIPCNFLTCKKCRDFSWKQLNFVAPFLLHVSVWFFSLFFVDFVVAMAKPIAVKRMSVYVEIAGKVYSSMEYHSWNYYYYCEYVWIGGWTSIDYVYVLSYFDFISLVAIFITLGFWMAEGRSHTRYMYYTIIR